MKLLSFIFFAVLIIGCKTNKNVVTNSIISDTINQNKSEKQLQTICPENGKCTTTIFRNQSLDIKTDEFGSIYYEKIDNPNTSVILFSYSRNVPKGVQDAGYREEIVFEINNSDKNISLANDQLQQTKMLYGRFCFCKGKTGNFAVTAGQLNLKQIGKKVQFDLQFKNNKVPQLLSFIAEVVL